MHHHIYPSNFKIIESDQIKRNAIILKIYFNQMLLTGVVF